MWEGAGEQVDVVVVGAGFAGVALLRDLRSRGLTCCVLEAADGVGGTWWWNRYPGARCDVDSLEYSYQFSEELQQEWSWDERYAGQAEILRYLDHVVERFGLLDGFRFGRTVAAATFDDAAAIWTVTCDTGEVFRAPFVIMATGCLSVPTTPTVAGIDSFAGRVVHTGRWPHDGVELDGKRVGIVGTGSSAVQAIPLLAEQAAELFVFQRTPSYVVPAHNGPMDRDEEAAVKADYAGFRARNDQRPRAFGSRTPLGETSVLTASPDERDAAFEARWRQGGLSFLGAFHDLMTDARANDVAAEFVRRKIREVVHDPVTADLLTPRHLIGCKRLCLDSGYFQTFNEPHVHLVDVNARPIDGCTAEGIVAGGETVPLDVLVLATGFDAMTGALARIDIRGAGGRSLRDHWADGPRSLFGLTVHGFPNLFTINGPGSPSVLTNMIVAIEHHVGWIGACIDHLRAAGLRTIEARAEDEAAWGEHVQRVAGGTIFPNCNSWFLGANVPGKPRVFMPLFGYPQYTARCREEAEAGYRSFELR